MRELTSKMLSQSSSLGLAGEMTSSVVSSEPKENVSNPSVSPLDVNSVVLVSPEVSKVSTSKVLVRSSPL